MLPLRRQHQLKILSVLLLPLSGCSADIQDSIVEAAQRHRQAMPRLDEALDETPTARIEKRLASSAVVPSPGRSNPFEIAGTYDSDSGPSEQTLKKKEIRILGFVELEKPMAILSIDGQSQTFATGDTHDRITVTEVSPPRARITLDGVSWYASLFDPR
jgi:hypothetical protein